MFKVSMVVVLALAMTGVGYADTVLVSESFDSHTSGQAFVSYDPDLGNVGLSPDVGTDWVLAYVQPQLSGVVSNDVAVSGSLSGKLVRGGPGAQGLYTSIGTGVAIDPTKTYTFSSQFMAANDQYGIAQNSGGIGLSAGPGSGFYAAMFTFASFGGKIGVNSNSGYDFSSNYVPQAGRWYKMEMVVSLGAPVGGLYPVLYDAFVTDDLGVRTQLANDYASGSLSSGMINYGWDLVVGANRALLAGTTSTVYFDNMLGTVVPEPATMSLLGLGALAFLRRKHS